MQVWSEQELDQNREITHESIYTIPLPNKADTIKQDVRWFLRPSYVAFLIQDPDREEDERKGRR